MSYNWLVWVALIFVAQLLVELLRMNVKLYRALKTELKLDQSVNSADFHHPPLSIVIPAKDEETYLEACVRSILASDYPNFELILVNDRSKDSTPEIMSRLAKEDERISVLSIETLPAGWTGKTHAMSLAAQKARGEILLFSDADAVFDSGLFSKCINYIRSTGTDMLSLLPGFTEKGFVENVVYPHLALGLSYFYPLSDVNDPASEGALASGCFIMMTGKAYDQVGTWKAFRTEVSEDIAMSKRLKKAGLRLRVIRGAGMVSTRPFSNLGELFKFWERTFYGGLEKSIPKVLRLILNYTTLLLLFFVIGWSAALTFTSESVLVPFFLFVLSTAAGFAVVVPFCIFLKKDYSHWAYGLTAPLGLGISAWVAIRTLSVIISNRGIDWRGSNYK